MKVLLLSDSDIQGGAARAAYRLHQGLKLAAVDSQILVQNKFSRDLNVTSSANNRIQESMNRSRIAIDNLPLKFYPQRKQTTFSLQWLPEKNSSQIDAIAPDIINLHWISAAFFRIENLAKLKQPLVWTLHDMWPFTGGCHYNQECDRYKKACGSCPQLDSHREGDLSRWVWRRKAKAWKNLNLTVVTPSNWLAKCARESSLFQDKRIEVIPNSLDTNIYRPINQKVARDLLKLPQDKKLILFLSLQATSDRRKGFHLLQPALQKLSQAGWQERLELIIVGASTPKEPPKFGFKSHFLGTLTDDLTLALAYSAADLFIAPSIQDNLPNTAIEALACGTPCVAFDIGGMSDAIVHQQNGYLAQPYQIDDLVRGAIWVIEESIKSPQINIFARTKAETEFALKVQANRYLSLFKEILPE